MVMLTVFYEEYYNYNIIFMHTTMH